jgi:predicted transcriptional regulator
MIDDKQKEILEFVKANSSCSSKEIHSGLYSVISYATVKRALTKLISDNLIISQGKGRGTKYTICPAYELFYPINVNQYFEQEIDERDIKDSFNFSLIPKVLSKVDPFSEYELKYLDDLQSKFTKNVSELSELEYSKELERLSIDLSWKSSQIEGNTYSLLETERLLKEENQKMMQ